MPSGASVRRWPSNLGALDRLPRGDQQVVEEAGGEVGLEQAVVHPLKREVAAERELVPAHGHAFGLDARLQRSQDPAVGVRQKLFSRDSHIGEAGALRKVAQLTR